MSFLSVKCFCQEGHLIINQDKRLDQLLLKQSQIYAADNTIDGYRIQIFMESGNDAVEHAQEIMKEFKETYPNMPVYLVFGQPYYRLRVGDFRTRLEAEKYHIEISQTYTNAFVTGDRIMLPKNYLCDKDDDPYLKQLLESNSQETNTNVKN